MVEIGDRSPGAGAGFATPVVLLIFNRPAHTRRVFEAIAGARPQQLLVIADGPRPEHANEARLCTEARAVIEEVDWPCEVKTHYSEANLGCRQRVASGLDWAFAQVDEAIILEDDCLPDASFFPFCEQMLASYRHDERVHMVRGCNLLMGRYTPPWSYYFSRFYNIWGWATWSRAWQHFDHEMPQWPELRESDWLERMLPEQRMVNMARYIFDAAYEDRFTTWDYHWVFCGWLREALAIVPANNLVTNIGYGADATHTRERGNALGNLPTRPLEFPLRHPPTISVHEDGDHVEWENVNLPSRVRPSLLQRLRRRLRQPLTGALQ